MAVLESGRGPRFKVKTFFRHTFLARKILKFVQNLEQIAQIFTKKMGKHHAPLALYVAL